MFCKNCGAEINEGAAFCLKCGAKVGLQPEAGSGIATTISGTDCQKDEPSSKMKHVMLSMFLLSIAFFVITAFMWFFWYVYADWAGWIPIFLYYTCIIHRMNRWRHKAA